MADPGFLPPGPPSYPRCPVGAVAGRSANSGNLARQLHRPPDSREDYSGKKLFDDFAIASMKFKMQLEILQSAKARFETSLFDIKQILQACSTPSWMLRENCSRMASCEELEI